MTSAAKVQANRANARASTGPKTTAGRRRSAGNALRHGLSLPVYSDPTLFAEVEALAHDIAGTDAVPAVKNAARLVGRSSDLTSAAYESRGTISYRRKSTTLIMSHDRQCVRKSRCYWRCSRSAPTSR